MESFKFIDVPNMSVDSEIHEISFSNRPQMMGHGMIINGQVFISDLSQHRVLTWTDLERALTNGTPDAIIGAKDLDDTDPDKTKDGLFWPLRLAFDGERLWVGEYKFSGRILSYPITDGRGSKR